jgi:hypothetical protein
MYEALGKSAQARYMELSDWEYARWTAFIMSRAAERPTAMMILAVDKMLSNLMVCEADRRRARVEIERTNAEDESASVASMMQEYRNAAGVVKETLAERRQRLIIS